MYDFQLFSTIQQLRPRHYLDHMVQDTYWLSTSILGLAVIFLSKASLSIKDTVQLRPLPPNHIIISLFHF